MRPVVKLVSICNLPPVTQGPKCVTVHQTVSSDRIRGNSFFGHYKPKTESDCECSDSCLLTGPLVLSGM